jgi:hypothetical protein
MGTSLGFSTIVVPPQFTAKVNPDAIPMVRQTELDLDAIAAGRKHTAVVPERSSAL